MSEKLMMDIGEKLKAYRKKLELQRGTKVTQAILAEELDVKRSVIADIERGSRGASKEVLSKLQEHSGFSMEYWYKGTEYQKPVNATSYILDSLIKEKIITSIEDLGNKSILDKVMAAIKLDLERKLNNE